mgnify:FL=1
MNPEVLLQATVSTDAATNDAVQSVVASVPAAAAGWLVWAILGFAFAGFAWVLYLGYKAEPVGLDKGEMRRAVAGFLIILFGLLVAASFFDGGPDVPQELKGIFAGAVATVLGFYFGARGVETAAKDAKDAQDAKAAADAQTVGEPEEPIKP